MQKITILIVILLGTIASHGVAAAPSSNVIWDSATRNLVKSGDVEKGKALALSCASCHGAEGVSPNPVFPNLAGQIARYTFKQLKDYQDHTRTGMMMSFVTRLSDQDMADISAFYASKPLPPAAESSGGNDIAIKLVKRGDGPRFLAPCESCHGRHGEGKIVDIPALAGQKEAYFIASMQEYKSNRRSNDIYSRMRLIAGTLSDEEIKALASHYASMGK